MLHPVTEYRSLTAICTGNTQDVIHIENCAQKRQNVHKWSNNRKASPTSNIKNRNDTWE